MPQKFDNKVAVRKIDIVKWDSDAFKQASEEFEINGIPYLRVYGPDGEFVGEEQMDLENLEKMIAGALE